MADTITAVRPVDSRMKVEKKEKPFRRGDDEEFEDVFYHSRKRRRKKTGEEKKEAPALSHPREDEALFRLMFQAESVPDAAEDAAKVYALSGKKPGEKIDIVR